MNGPRTLRAALWCLLLAAAALHVPRAELQPRGPTRQRVRRTRAGRRPRRGALHAAMAAGV